MAIQLTESQQAAVRLLDKSQVCLFTGGGGTGKTTTLAEWIKQTPELRTYCFAPTGKAAQRMQEAFAESGVSLNATTIHAGLRPVRCGYDGRGWQFEYNADNPLTADRVIVDECSMLATPEMSWLLQAVSPGTKLILVGDSYQLPPVGKGKPFKDMIASGKFPHANLTEVHRYAGRIAHVCKGIREGKRIIPSKELNLDPDAGEFGPENYRHIERRNAPQILDAMNEICRRMKERGYDPIKDIQVLVTRNDKGGLCRKVVNPRLQALLNPNGRGRHKCPYRIGDKVICKKNNVRPIWETKQGRPFDTGEKCYVANGEDGIVVALDDNAVFAKFRDGVCRFSRGSWEGEIVMGYAITNHSAQGSGFPIAIYLIDDSRLNDRNLIYTGLSRSKQILFTIGQLGLLNKQIAKSQLSKRKTFLKEYLQGVM